MSGGNVIIARSLWDDPAFQDEPFSEREAWVWMICEASWKPRKKRVGSVVVDLERGQFAASIRFMADAFSWHRNKADRFIKRVQKAGMIRAESGTGVNVITICKYDDYQLSPKHSGTAAGQQRDSSGTNENKGNKGNTDKEGKPSLAKKRGSKLPDDEKCVQILSVFVSEQTARSFIQHRKDMRKPMTENAANAILKKLEGHPSPDDVLTDSIANGWQGVFPEKTNGGSNGNRTNKNGNSKSDADAREIAFAARAIRTPDQDCF